MLCDLGSQYHFDILNMPGSSSNKMFSGNFHEINWRKGTEAVCMSSLSTHSPCHPSTDLKEDSWSMEVL